MTCREVKKTLSEENLNIENTDLENALDVYVDKRGNYVFNLNSTVYFPDLDSVPDSYFEYYQAKENEHWPIISYNIYSTTRYAWLLQKLNKVRDPITPPRKGQTILYIPSVKLDTVLNSVFN